MPADPTRGLLDTNIVILRRAIPDELLDEMAISAVTLAGLSAGVHLVSGDGAEAIEERSRRADVLARVENEFDQPPIPACRHRVSRFGSSPDRRPRLGQHIVRRRRR